MEHRQRISKIESINKIGNGEHIHRIQDSGNFFREKQRRMSIEASNQLLLSRM